MTLELTESYFSALFQDILEGADTEALVTFRVPLVVFLKETSFLLDTHARVTNFFADFRTLVARFGSWHVNSDIIEVHKENDHMECYHVNTRLHGASEARVASWSAKFYIRRSPNSLSIEMIEFV